MPLTNFQKEICRLLAVNRSEESYLAGGAALHISPTSKRFSNDLDYFHDSVARVGESFAKDSELLAKNGILVDVEMNQPGYIRAVVSRISKEPSESSSTKIEWAHDSAWRFLPPVLTPESGFQLHPVDLAVNKILALAGRDEARDFLDILHADKNILPLGALIWAACGKDPGFTPDSLLELIKRRGHHRPEDFARLLLTEPVDLKILKSEWLTALEAAKTFIDSQDPELLGCLFYNKRSDQFVAPGTKETTKDPEVVPHFGRPGGVLPQPARA